MNQAAASTLQDARKTLKACENLISGLDKDGAGGADKSISIAPRQGKELSQFMGAHCKELHRYCVALEKDPDSELSLQLLATRYMELEEAHRFVNRAFIQPRTSGTEQQALEAADWLCVDGFQLFVCEREESPVGPLVAIDSGQSPAVWAPGADLPIPSLFQTEPKKIAREGGSSPDRVLPPFPLVCLPGHLAHSPEYYPLLSHEVGHAVDNALGVTNKLKEELPAGIRSNYWKAWMREIFADAVAVTLSGEAFLLALTSYLAVLRPFEEVSASNIYPGNTLRLALVGECLNYYGTQLSVAEEIPREEELGRFGKTAKALVVEFREEVLPVVAKYTLDKNSAWPEEQQALSQLAGTVPSTHPFKWPSLPFRLMPSLISLAQRADASLDTYERFRELHKSVKPEDRPKWVEAPTNWIFSEEYLPSLRPTLLGADGQFKVPPLLLLGTHQKIAFVGATNWQLAKMMEQAFKERGEKSWDEILLFFATDELLEQVEYGERNGREDRDRSEAEFLALLQQGRWARRWAVYRFNGPPVFASYWDWDRQGGRIHVSPALLGTVIGKCPAADHIWHQQSPTDHYQKYVAHLEALLRVPATRVVMKSTD